MKAGHGVMMWVLAGVILAVAGAAWGQERVTGTVVALVNEKCGMKPGLCEGSVAVGEPGHARTFRVKAGVTTISKGGKLILLEEVRLADRLSIEIAERTGNDVAKAIEVTSSDDHSSPPDRHSSPSDH